MEKRAVLCVEDESPILKLYKLILESGGYTVHTARNGLEAVEVVRNLAHDISLIFMDLKMPVMNGLAALEEIKDLREDYNIPAVILTAFAPRDINEICARLKCDYMHKPVTREEFLKKAGQYAPLAG